MTGDKELEKGSFALLIAAYLTLNTSLNLLNKVSLFWVAIFFLELICALSIQLTNNLQPDQLPTKLFILQSVHFSYFDFVTFAVGPWSLWSGIPSSPY